MFLHSDGQNMVLNFSGLKFFLNAPLHKTCFIIAICANQPLAHLLLNTCKNLLSALDLALTCGKKSKGAMCPQSKVPGRSLERRTEPPALLARHWL